MDSDPHQELCSRMMLPDSLRMKKIFQMIVDETDAKLLLAMPATAEELSAATGFGLEEVQTRLKTLFRKGVAFESVKTQGIVYRAPKHLIQFHDASNQWPEAPVEFHNLWREFMNTEYPGLLAMMASAGFAGFMRVVPTLQALEGTSGVRPFDDLSWMIEQATELAVCRCPCRLEERACQAPLESCIQVGRGAQYVLKRGTGKEITKPEALKLLRDRAESGYVHLVENKKGLGTVICNCCSCCCAIIKPIKIDPACRPILTPSRFQPKVDAELCTGDGLCAEVCPMEAISVDEEEGVARVDPKLCIGCGLCLGACQGNAVLLETIRPEEFIPG